MQNSISEKEQFEKIPTILYPDADAACTILATEIRELIEARDAEGKKSILGLATGSTPTRLYRELIRLHREGLSFANVITFNLDEYYGLEPDHPESYSRFMREQLFDHINIPKANTHVPDGLVGRHEVFEYCQKYEQKIEDVGGLDLQILGIGRTGHIGFNEPGSSRDSLTRLVNLDALTRRDAARDFLGVENVPRYAITMGVGTILKARKVVLMAWGEGKAEVVASAIQEPPVDSLPASFLQGHPNVRFLVDNSASNALTRVRHPWLVGSVSWNPRNIRKAVTWLSGKVGKPILKLVDEDYSEQGLAELLTEHGPAYELNILVFNDTQHTLTGWPGGKPHSDDTHRPERANPHPKRALIFSPEPQDDLLGLGGTLHRLIDQGHEVTVAYLTSGNLAVPDADAIKATELILDAAEVAGDTETGETRFAHKVQDQLRNKEQFSLDTPEIRRLKGMIRRGEARAACLQCGLPIERIRFLDLPFYEKGRYRQFMPTDDDESVVATLLNVIQPHQVYLTGNLADPSSVQALGFKIVESALNKAKASPWFSDCFLWLYRSADREWNIHELDMSVPLSPDELANKVKGIYQHQTQRNQTPMAGQGGEVWKLAEAADREIACKFDALGLAEYEAIEGFQRHQ
ncbi:MAG: glucosamine-6-phosphate deaminase [Opitutae bacterium]|nr:glucosamine-6-phosphate deaminase [Opitutae bacterium]